MVDRSQQDRQDYEGGLGGYMMKDHLWFFGASDRVPAYDGQFVSAGSEPILGPAVAGVDRPFGFDREHLLGQETGRFGQGTTIMTTVFGRCPRRAPATWPT